MIKSFIKYSYIFCKQDKNLRMQFKYYEGNVYELFCGYPLIKYKLIHACQLNNYIYYIIKFDNNKYVYIWNEYDHTSYSIDDFYLPEINKLFKEFKKEWESLQNENI